MHDLRRDLHRDWRKWSRTERFSAVIILAAMITVIVPAAVEFTHQSATDHHQVLTLAR
ncbi:MAG TPA: hypothetical protein VN656_11775 [Stellaceae bacterium]|jgi:hypothetical protein|nr:hypothetical protein [Stellaceae bacterium]